MPLQGLLALRPYQGPSEPSHSVCDLAASCFQKNLLKRIEWKEGLKGLGFKRLAFKKDPLMAS